MIRLMIAEDQALVRGALATLLAMEEGIEVVAEAGDGQAAIDLALRERPDVALLDIEMPGQSGLDVVACLARELPTCRCLIVTTFARAGYLQRAVKAGAAGYLLKDAAVSDVASAVRTVHLGGRVMDSQLAAAALTFENPLLPREVDLLRRASQGLTTRELARELFLAEGTVRNYLSDIMAKLGVSSRREAVETARQSGWL